MIALVEGAEANTGSSIAARHSWTRSDVELDQLPAPCLTLVPVGDEAFGTSAANALAASEEGAAAQGEQLFMNFSAFHSLVPYDEATSPEFSELVPSLG